MQQSRHAIALDAGGLESFRLSGSGVVFFVARDTYFLDVMYATQSELPADHTGIPEPRGILMVQSDTRTTLTGAGLGCCMRSSKVNGLTNSRHYRSTQGGDALS